MSQIRAGWAESQRGLRGAKPPPGPTNLGPLLSEAWSTDGLMAPCSRRLRVQTRAPPNSLELNADLLGHCASADADRVRKGWEGALP